MTQKPIIVREHFYSLIYIAWWVSLVFLILGGNFRVFIRPSFVYFIWAALLILLVFIVSGLSVKNDHKVKMVDVVRGGILLLPLLALWVSHGKPLGSHAFMKKNVLPLVLSDVLHGDSKKLPDQIGQNSYIGQQVLNVTILDLIKNPERYHGKLITTDGMALSNETYNREAMQDNIAISKASFVLFRFKIVCCVADSQPLGILVETTHSPDVADNGWYRVTGRFMLNKGKIGIVSQAVVSELEVPPEQPYLY